MKIIKINTNEYLDKAFDMIPTNAIIDKGRCGIGGTTMELNSKRHSILVVPNVSIIESKTSQFDFLFGVKGGVNISHIKEYIENIIRSGGVIKIMSTPDSFRKIISACESLDFDIYSKCFLLLDECHSFITERSYRENISVPLEYLWKFENKSLISATPYEFSDPRFEKLKLVKIESEHLNSNIETVFTKDLFATLKSLIEQAKEHKDVNLHIFYNSVTDIPIILSLIKADKVDSTKIFCADNAGNRGKLGKYADRLFSLKDNDYHPGFINFYTTKYWEGWDLIDENAVVVLLSDIKKEHTLFEISTKGIQAIGRLRNKAKHVFHITNCYEFTSTSKKKIKDQIIKNSSIGVDSYNFLSKAALFKNILPKIKTAVEGMIKSFSTFNSDGTSATLDMNKLDSIIYSSTISSGYDMNSIVESWKKLGFSVKQSRSEHLLGIEDYKIIKNNRIGQWRKNKVIIDTIIELEKSNFVKNENLDDFVIDFSGYEEWAKLKNENLNLYKYYECLGYDKLRELSFSSSKMKKEYIIANSSKIEVSEDFKKLVYHTFSLGGKYKVSYIKDKLNEFARRLGIDVSYNFKANDIMKYFDVRDCTLTDDINGRRSRAYQIIGKLQ